MRGTCARDNQTHRNDHDVFVMIPNHIASINLCKRNMLTMDPMMQGELTKSASAIKLRERGIRYVRARSRAFLVLIDGINQEFGKDGQQKGHSTYIEQKARLPDDNFE